MDPKAKSEEVGWDIIMMRRIGDSNTCRPTVVQKRRTLTEVKEFCRDQGYAFHMNFPEEWNAEKAFLGQGINFGECFSVRSSVEGIKPDTEQIRNITGNFGRDFLTESKNVGLRRPITKLASIRRITTETIQLLGIEGEVPRV